jgi:hypothetical protein
MTTQLPEDPLNHIKTWQAKFKEHKQQCGVAEMDTPGTTKDSREALHDTNSAVDAMTKFFPTWRNYWKDASAELKAEMNALHDTSNTTVSVKDWREDWKDVLNASEDTFQEKVLAQVKKELSTHKQKTIDNFLDTICCALEEMNGDEVFDCFLEAVQSQWDYTRKEHKKTNNLFKRVLGDSK